MCHGTCVEVNGSSPFTSFETRVFCADAWLPGSFLCSHRSSAVCYKCTPLHPAVSVAPGIQTLILESVQQGNCFPLSHLSYPGVVV